MAVPALVLAVSLAATGSLGAQTTAPEDDPWAYFGAYQLTTGEWLQGGLMEEGDEALWAFMDPERPGTGDLYEPQSTTRFRSVMKPGSILEFSRLEDGTYQQVEIHHPDGRVERGQRAFAIERREAEIPLSDGGRISATLLLPNCPGPRPLVVLANGSGRTTRHVGLFATFFLARGMAYALYDKRDADAEKEGWQEQDLATIGAEIAALKAWAVRQPGIDARRAGIFGSSQGGWTGSMAAVEPPVADFLLVRAGPGVDERDTYLHEVRQELRLDGLNGLDLDKAIQLADAIYDLAIAGRPITETDSLVRPWLEEEWYRKAFGEGPVSDLWSERWWRWSGRNMPVSAIPFVERFEGPVLWFLAADDQNVPVISSHVALTDAFERAPGDDHQLVVLPDVAHNFMLDMPSPKARFAPGFWDGIDQWLRERGLSEAGCWETPAQGVQGANRSTVQPSPSRR